MRNHVRQPYLYSFLSAFVLCITVAGSVLAQESRDDETDTSDSTSGRTTIIIESDGRVFVNGEEVDRDYAGVLGFNQGKGDVVIIRPEHDVRIHPAPGRPFRFHLEEGWIPGDDEFAEMRRKLEAIPFDAIRLEKFEPFFEDAAFLARESAETIRLEQEARELARRAREADGEERQRLERELRDKLSEALDAKFETRRERIERLEEELREERELLEMRQRSREEIVDRRLRELLGEKDALDW